MNTDAHHTDGGGHGDYVVSSPRPTDALGHMLRGVFDQPALPDDLMLLLLRLDRVGH